MALWQKISCRLDMMMTFSPFFCFLHIFSIDLHYKNLSFFSRCIWSAESSWWKGILSSSSSKEVNTAATKVTTWEKKHKKIEIANQFLLWIYAREHVHLKDLKLNGHPSNAHSLAIETSVWLCFAEEKEMPLAAVYSHPYYLWILIQIMLSEYMCVCAPNNKVESQRSALAKQ